MHFAAGILTLALAAAGVSAAPNPELQARQPGVVYVRFYAEGGCQGDWIEDTVYFDDGSSLCDPETLSIQYASWAVVRNEAGRDRKFIYNSLCS